MKISIKIDKTQKRYLGKSKYSTFSRSVIVELLKYGINFCFWFINIEENRKVQAILNEAITKINNIKLEDEKL